MVGGLERYYQLARCFRDEDFRKDRQPEFTQIDVEMSFVTREDVIAVAEDIVIRLWSELACYRVPTPLPRLTYADAMARYGSDKPDLRFGCELTDLTEYFAARSSGSSRRRTSGPWSCPAAPRRPGASSTAGRSWPARAAPAAWPTR